MLDARVRWQALQFIKLDRYLETCISVPNPISAVLKLTQKRQVGRRQPITSAHNQTCNCEANSHSSHEISARSFVSNIQQLNCNVVVVVVVFFFFLGLKMYFFNGK